MKTCLALRRFVRIPTLVLVVIAVASADTAANEAASSAGKPNIIYIMVDDLGYGDLGCYGQKTVMTPHIDRMAREGMRFTDHYAGHTVCRPSRLVLWTGQHVGHTGLIGNRDRSLTSTELTVARRLKAAGYATGGVGKWSLGNVDRPEQIDNDGHPNRNGFDYWYGYMNQGNAHNYYPPFLWENDRQVMLKGNVLSDDPNARKRVSTKRVTYSHDLMTEAAFGFIRKHKTQPFLLHIHWTIPHANNEGGRVTGNGMEVPDLGPYKDKSWPAPEKGFAGMIHRMDADVGRLFDLLKTLKIDKSTLVVFTSDNGPHNEGGHKHDFFDSNGPLNGFKRSMHDGGIRVPLIARWPGKIASGSQSDHPSAFYDFLPTACELAGTDPPPSKGHEFTDGISYLPSLLGDAKQAKHEYLYWASQEGATSVGVRYGHWKLVQYRAPRKKKRQGKSSQDRAAKPDWRLYDLDKDLGEQDDLAKQHPDVVKTILGLLKRDGLL